MCAHSWSRFSFFAGTLIKNWAFSQQLHMYFPMFGLQHFFIACLAKRVKNIQNLDDLNSKYLFNFWMTCILVCLVYKESGIIWRYYFWVKVLYSCTWEVEYSMMFLLPHYFTLFVTNLLVIGEDCRSLSSTRNSKHRCQYQIHVPVRVRVDHFRAITFLRCKGVFI